MKFRIKRLDQKTSRKCKTNQQFHGTQRVFKKLIIAQLFHTLYETTSSISVSLDPTLSTQSAQVPGPI